MQARMKDMSVSSQEKLKSNKNSNLSPPKNNKNN